MNITLERYRWQLYNATVVSLRRVHEDLIVMRVCGDRGLPSIVAGQYTLLGLGDWEPGVDRSSIAAGKPTLIRRPYSVSCPILDEHGAVQRIGDGGFLEFYVARIRPPTSNPVSLTPRLFALQEGDRLFLGPHARGRYTLEPVQADEDVIFCATGTGEAPHNAMLAELLARGHRGRIVATVSVRMRRDLAYLDIHRQAERLFPRYRYVPLTTRERENLEPGHEEYVGKLYLQQLFADDDRCRTALGFVPQAGNARFFLCGSPAMIGLPRRQADGSASFPELAGMVETLARRGFRLEEPKVAGNVHCEKYW